MNVGMKEFDHGKKNFASVMGDATMKYYKRKYLKVKTRLHIKFNVMLVCVLCESDHFELSCECGIEGIE